jgi:hypothetical protein
LRWEKTVEFLEKLLLGQRPYRKRLIKSLVKVLFSGALEDGRRRKLELALIARSRPISTKHKFQLELQSPDAREGK